jgi:hypothetical protein
MQTALQKSLRQIFVVTFFAVKMFLVCRPKSWNIESPQFDAKELEIV